MQILICSIPPSIAAECTWNKTYNILSHLKFELTIFKWFLFTCSSHVKSISISYSLFIPKIYWEFAPLFTISLAPTLVQTTIFSFLDFYYSPLDGFSALHLTTVYSHHSSRNLLKCKSDYVFFFFFLTTPSSFPSLLQWPVWFLAF